MVSEASTSLAEAIQAATGQQPLTMEPLSGGCVGQVYRVMLKGGEDLVAKWDPEGKTPLSVEGYMLAYLRKHSDLPVPDLYFSSDHLLLMAYVGGSNRFDAEAERHAAQHLAALHAVTAPTCGLEQDTLIGGLHQPNPRERSWLTFYANHRLVYMASEAARAGRLPVAMAGRVEKLAARLPEWLSEPERPSLLHGDAWAGNVLAKNGRITAFLDPAIYYGHPEVELAFTTLFGSFGQPFFEAYQSVRPIAPGFFETRIRLYQLYPLLVHVRLFGGGYVSSVEQTLSRFGF